MDNKTIRILTHFFSLLVGTTGSTYAQDVRVEGFTPAEAIERVNPRYPNVPLEFNQEGWVEISMMIDTNGKPFEIMVQNAAGHKDFQREALDAIEDWTFRPASFNGAPTVSHVRTILRFQIEGQKGARRPFVRAYREFSQANKTAPQEEVAPLLTKLTELDGQNAYELAFLNLARFLYAARFGTPYEQMTSLDAALSYSDETEDEVYLPEVEARFARQELFKLQAKNLFLQEALETYHYFEENEDEESVEMFRPLAEQLNTLKQAANQNYEIPATLDERGNFNLQLFRNKVYVTGIEGKIAEFNLRCERKYVGFAVEADVAYDILPEWGPCSLTVVGDTGSRFKLGQL